MKLKTTAVLTVQGDDVNRRKFVYVAPTMHISDVKLNEGILLEASNVTIEDGFDDGGDM